jgi:uroporphyrinogen-III decarboxylase
MEKKWEEMTWQEKREKRFEKWISPPGVKFKDKETEEAYKERVNRIIKVIKLEEPDRVPCIPPSGFQAYNAGTDLKTTMYDSSELKRASLKFLREFDMDVFSSGFTMPGKIMEKLGDRSFFWPGHGLPDDAMMIQFNEQEFMKEDEYDAMINDPSDYILRSYIPRATESLEAFSKLPAPYSMVRGAIPFVAAFTNPEIRKSFQTLIEVSNDLMEWGAVAAEIEQTAISEGYPSFGIGGAGPPFDSISDGLRGVRGIVRDMFRQPEKLIEAMERILPLEIDMAIAAGNASISPVLMIPIHKGDDSFMSDEQFERFYWPTFRKLLVAMVNEGLVPYPFAEGRYSNRLKTIKDLPPTGVMWLFDQTDMVRAKKELGDISCIAGNVPASLMITGTPEQVKEQCRKLIYDCAPGGGYILTGGAGIHRGNPENIRTMMAATYEYGRY